MSTEHDVEHHHHHKNRHLAQRFENLIGVLMVIAIAILAVGLIYGIINTGSTPSYLK
ncbi:MAG TPA: hypothetical protein VJS38_15380 [Phenylobacterium sp.]|jgi:hypothetical protein|uniref:hypothetical protein n=1 Tax=Phenylobacterium sp. TaxID=1871053 RepID=UPI002B482D2D|nr:hypothetical protein [Phenylobacterium sp.]HKR89554.1 hypothetical protein [Phenylobacterium sp.]